jgi:hypothetical protein
MDEKETPEVRKAATGLLETILGSAMTFMEEFRKQHKISSDGADSNVPKPRALRSRTGGPMELVVLQKKWEKAQAEWEEKKNAYNVAEARVNRVLGIDQPLQLPGSKPWVLGHNGRAVQGHSHNGSGAARSGLEGAARWSRAKDRGRGRCR